MRTMVAEPTLDEFEVKPGVESKLGIGDFLAARDCDLSGARNIVDPGREANEADAESGIEAFRTTFPARLFGFGLITPVPGIFAGFDVDVVVDADGPNPLPEPILLQKLS